jgi:hypothetical protein
MSDTTKNPTSEFEELKSKVISQPLVEHIYTADPSAYVFGGKNYIYPSHDIDAGIPEDDLGSHFGMRDYHILLLDDVMEGEVTDHRVVLSVSDIPQMNLIIKL